MFIFILILLMVSPKSYSLITEASKTAINVTDFGASPNSRENAVPTVQKALQACRNLKNPILVFPQGRYDFWPQHCVEKDYYESNTTDNNPKRLAIFIKNFKNLTIDGQGSEFIFHGIMQPFTVDSSENVIIKNLKIDWEIPLMAEAQVVDTSAKYIDLRIDPCETPYIIEKDKLTFVGEGWKSRWWGTMEFERETKQVAYRTGDWGCLGRGWREYKAEELEKGLVRLHHHFQRLPGKGNYLVLRHSARDHAGIFIQHSKNVSVKNVDLYFCAGLGVLAQFSENITLDNFNAVPNPEKERILSGHDDGAQISNCKGLVKIENCKFEALMDDPVNIHGTSVRIIEKLAANKLLCKFMHHQSVGMIWGRSKDKVGFIENESMQTIGFGIVKSFSARDKELFEVQFENDIPGAVQEGDALENMTWSPEVIIRNNFFASNRARGLLISTPGKVIIQENIFESSGSAILIAGDANGWYESGAVRDVLIKKNIFRNACLTSMYQFCEGIISIFPIIPKLDSNKPFHRNIRIEENEFHPFDYPVLYAKSVDGLTITKNRLIRSFRFEPFHSRRATFNFEACENVKIQNNLFKGGVLGKNIKIDKMLKDEIKVAKGQGLRFN